MSEATLIFPHQLFEYSPALEVSRIVYLIEEPLLLTHNPIHRQKLIFHKLSLDTYQMKLEKDGFKVKRLKIEDFPKTENIFKHIQAEGVLKMHIVDTTDFLLEKAINNSGIERVWYESPLFVLSKDEAVSRYNKSGRFMAKFYKQLRKDKNILVDKDGNPEGGKWSFDEDNRKKLPKNFALPKDIIFAKSTVITEAGKWAEGVPAEKYGEAGCWLPYTHNDAREYLTQFLKNRFSNFGSYEDALSKKSTRLFHSTLSPLLNVGLLTPDYVLETVQAYAKENQIPINSLEGFVRQILGWREFIRAAYECDGVAMRTTNFWNHTNKLPEFFWAGSTSINPLDISIERALSYGYNHHIERLMVLGNFMLLSQINPDEVYRWFMGMYLDAYDWVMVPNIYGMSQFADSGLFATKPYISGSNYLRKMSDYPKGEWEEIWTALYWNFIEVHKDFFKSNHRLSMMPRLFEKMDKQKREKYLELANRFLTENFKLKLKPKELISN